MEEKLQRDHNFMYTYYLYYFLAIFPFITRCGLNGGSENKMERFDLPIRVFLSNRLTYFELWKRFGHLIKTIQWETSESDLEFILVVPTVFFHKFNSTGLNLNAILHVKNRPHQCMYHIYLKKAVGNFKKLFC